MKENNERKKNIYLSIGLILFALCVTGATYAYFALTASNNSITGTVGGASFSVTATKVFPTTQSTNMIPQLEGSLQDAINSPYNCVDDNNNVICHVYKATITNGQKATVELYGTVSFDYETNNEGVVREEIPNLKWKRITNETTIGDELSSYAHSNERTFVDSVVLAPGATQDFYLVVWVDEIGELQRDVGTFRVNIKFYSNLTSTLKPVEWLKEAKVGDYISYTGNNGCPEGHCDGTNANYVDDTNMGYCSYSSSKFIDNGWRVMAKDAGGVYIVSAGAPECMGTLADGTICDSNDSCVSYITNVDDMELHIKNLNDKALTYCNRYFSKGEICDETTAWAMAESDYQKITGTSLSTCLGTTSELCGENNTFIDIGGFYWYAVRDMSDVYTIGWYPDGHYINFNYSNFPIGVRPVLYLRSNIEIRGGTGVYGDPYGLYLPPE